MKRNCYWSWSHPSGVSSVFVLRPVLHDVIEVLECPRGERQQMGHERGKVSYFFFDNLLHIKKILFNFALAK
jgi:hypothetical protein